MVHLAKITWISPSLSSTTATNTKRSHHHYNARYTDYLQLLTVWMHCTVCLCARVCVCACIRDPNLYWNLFNIHDPLLISSIVSISFEQSKRVSKINGCLTMVMLNFNLIERKRNGRSIPLCQGPDFDNYNFFFYLLISLFEYHIPRTKECHFNIYFYYDIGKKKKDTRLCEGDWGITVTFDSINRFANDLRLYHLMV